MHDTPSNLPYPEDTSASGFQTPRNGSGAPPELTKHLSAEGPPNFSEDSPSRALRARSDALDVGREATGNEGAGAERPTGLVLEGRLQPPQNSKLWTFNGRECPHDGREVFDPTTGEVAWSASCKSARCERCSRRVSRRTFALARTSIDGCQDFRQGKECSTCSYWVPKRARFITLTTSEPLGDWRDWRFALQNFRRNLDRHGVAGEMLYVRENGSQTGMEHVHIVQTGPRKIPMNVLDSAWPYGSTNIQAAREATDYLGKQVLRYVGKGADARETIEEHMNLNGGRAAHWTRGFFWGIGRDDFAKVHPVPGVYRLATSEPGYGGNHANDV